VPLLELPHWLMIAGTFLVMFGLIGLAFSPKSQVEAEVEAEPELLPGDLDSWKAQQSRSLADQGRTAA